MFNHLSDLVYASRTLLRSRSFTAVCVISLGLGMGVVIGIMLLLRMVFGTPAGVKDDGLVELVIRPSGALRAQVGTAILDTWSYPDYLDVRDASGIAVTGWSRGEGLVRLPDEPAARPVPTLYVSSNYFSTVGVTLARGRGFTPVDDAARAEPEAVIGHRLWQLRFGSDPNIIGRAITINQTDYVIVGVTPEEFRGHLAGVDNPYHTLWLPLSRHPRLLAAESARFTRDGAWVRVLGRLSEGTTLAQADVVVQSIMAALAGRFPATHQNKVGGAEAYFPVGARLRSQVQFGRMMLYGLSAMVLLVVGLNLSGMMLVRSAMRERELAIRLAIGASRWRLMRIHLSEALVLALLGGGLASAVIFGGPVLLAWWFDLRGAELHIFKPDALIAVQCVALCFATTLVLGLLPALRFSRPSVVSALKNDIAGSRRVGRLQRFTAAAQAGIAVPFLVICGVRIEQARVTAMADVGFQPHGLYSAEFNLATVGKTDDDRRTFVRTVQGSLAQAPGVASVSLGDGMPLDFQYRNARVAPQGKPLSTFVTAHVTRIGEGYLDTIGTRMLAGRTIDIRDSLTAERVVLLSEPLARQLFPAGDPLGERVAFSLEGSEPETYTVVGVTADLVSTQMGNPRPQMFISLAQHPSSRLLVIARGASADPSVRRAFEHAVAAADPDYVLGSLMTGEELVERSSRDILTEGGVSSLAAGVALVLASLGVYGVIAFMVATRTREIGVRVALGASRGRVLRDVLGDALKLVVPGIGLGLVLAVLWVRVADPSWYPLGGVEPLVYSVAAATAFVVALLAGIPSARRAAAVQPIVAMRSE